MGATSPRRLPPFCLNRAATRVRVRSRHVDSVQPVSSSETEASAAACSSDDGERLSDHWSKPDTILGRRVMIVVDSSNEAMGALQWALTHTVQSQDTLVLLHVTKPSKPDEASYGEQSSRGYELVYSMKNICFIRRPDVHVQIRMVEGKEKGPAIVQEARKQGVGLLVIGQRKRSLTWHLLRTLAGNRGGDGHIEYCIKNADCMTLAVRRKSRRLGGYLITSKRHRDFWLLA